MEQGVGRMSGENTRIVKDVPYLVHEGALARMERTVSRLWILCILLLLLLFGSNLAWIIYELQYVDIVDETSIEATQSTDGGSNFIVGGDLDYGETNG